MVEHSRYNINDDQAGISNGVLKNKLGITNIDQLNNAETLLLEDTHEYFVSLLKKGEISFDLSLLFDIHTHFLGTLYDWAGEIRNVNISKGKTFFIPAQYIPQALNEFEQILEENLPKKEDSKKIIARKLAIIHSEINAIHPFREGNGRTIRLFLDLLAIFSGYDIIDYSKSSTKQYIHACREGMKKEYAIMEKVMLKGLKKL